MCADQREEKEEEEEEERRSRNESLDARIELMTGPSMTRCKYINEGQSCGTYGTITSVRNLF